MQESYGPCEAETSLRSTPNKYNKMDSLNRLTDEEEAIRQEASEHHEQNSGRTNVFQALSWVTDVFLKNRQHLTITDRRNFNKALKKLLEL